MIRLTNVKLGLDEGGFARAASAALKTDIKNILAVDIVKRSIDARRGEVKFIYTFDVKTSTDENKLISRIKNASYAPEKKPWIIKKGSERMETRPVIIGAGPAGLFSALILSEYGYRPIILERGKKVDERTRDVDLFFAGKGLIENSNICFGEGGAGTFSDGKLKTRISDPRCYYVLKTLREAGAPSSILYDSNPHVGTDILKIVIKNIRAKIESNGGEFVFSAKADALGISNGMVKSVSSGDIKYDTQTVVLAIGHSARDTYQMLMESGVEMQQKPFAMGLRIEHPREIIDRAQYHDFAGHKKLGAASYSLNVNAGGEKAYTFCMCPGGVVVNASSEKNMLCVNGMSLYKRDGKNSNSAVVCRVNPETMGESPLTGIELQRKYERIAFELGGGDYGVPAMRVCDFLEDGKPKAFGVIPTALPKALPCSIKSTLPESVYETIKRALPEMGKRIKGFDMGDAVLSAVESRTSSPVRITRNEGFQSVNTAGLYPAGEGAGYAGGIVSSAVDGLRAAESIIGRYSSKSLGSK